MISKQDRTKMKDAVQQARANGGMFFSFPEAKTTVYVQPCRRRIVRVATTICHPSDRYIKEVGRYQVYQHYLCGRFVEISIPSWNTRTLRQRLQGFITSTF